MEEMVTEVLDGDSFKIANKTTIRLASLDAPEAGEENPVIKDYWEKFRGKLLLHRSSGPGSRLLQILRSEKRLDNVYLLAEVVGADKLGFTCSS